MFWSLNYVLEVLNKGKLQNGKVSFKREKNIHMKTYLKKYFGFIFIFSRTLLNSTFN